MGGWGEVSLSPMPLTHCEQPHFPSSNILLKNCEKRQVRKNL